jgi:hypothetical protein
MNNGELRYRLLASDGSAYSRTEASADGGWQNSHHHEKVLETYIVQHKWLALAELDGDDLRLRIMHPDDTYTTRVGVPHNVYLPGYAVIHTVKHGGAGGSDDWFSDPRLDARTKHLSEDQILGLAGEQRRRA